MKRQTYQTYLRKWAAGCALALLTAPLAHSAGTGQLGILDTSGINPTTSSAWQVGDTYRFVFVGSVDRDAQSTDISVYNTWAQDLANASSLNIGASQGVTWNIIGSTSSVDARDNTSTNTGTGESIFLINGSTAIATNYADLWDGAISNAINLDENGDSKSPNWAFTGTGRDGTSAINEGQARGPLGADVGNGEVSQAGSVLSAWIWRTNTSEDPTGSLPMLAMSDTLTVVPEASSALLIGLGGLVLLRRRRR
jgi:hypothetical protein